MRKNLQNAMAKNFQKMVNEQPTQDTSEKNSTSNDEKKVEKKQKIQEEIAEVEEEISNEVSITEEEADSKDNKPVPSEPEEPVQVSTQQVAAQPVQPVNQVPTQNVSQPIMQQPVQPAQPIIPEPVPQIQYYQPPIQSQPLPTQQPLPLYNTEQMVSPVMYQNYAAQTMNRPVQEVQTTKSVNTKSGSKKSIPLVPDEKSSGVLHIRLGELRSYVDFMTQSTKMSYQQYISNLIEQDFEKNKDLYLKYKSFMEQLNM